MPLAQVLDFAPAGLRSDVRLSTATIPLTSSPAEGTCAGAAPLPHNPDNRRAAPDPPRDHVIYSLALGTGLRLAEVVGLNVGDVFASDGTPRVRVRVRREIAKGGRPADVFLPDRLVAKLRRFWRWKRDRGEDLAPDAPLFCNQSGRRISKRRVQFAWATWQRRAGFDRVYGFHCTRPTAISAAYRMTHDLYLAQRFARHASPLTTTAYTHPSDQEMAGRVRGLAC